MLGTGQYHWACVEHSADAEIMRMHTELHGVAIVHLKKLTFHCDNHIMSNEGGVAYSWIYTYLSLMVAEQKLHKMNCMMRKDCTEWNKYYISAELDQGGMWSFIHYACLEGGVATTGLKLEFDNTVEPPNKEHFGACHVVLCRGIVLFSEVQNVFLWEWYFEECPLQRGCPFFRRVL